MSSPATDARVGTDAPEKDPQITGVMETYSYDDDIVRKFVLATVVWGIIGMLVGVIIALELVLPSLNINMDWMFQPWLNFGRLRPLHTNVVIFAFAGNAIFAAVYYSTQRLCKARMYSDALGKFHFWGWQCIIVAAVFTLPFGITQSKEYAELEWPIDLAIAVVWLVFAFNFFGTLARRRERHLYVALWFYIATIIAITILHVFNNLVIPLNLTKSYPIYAGVQDAFVQWWYGHNMIAFFLTMPFLGMMYYFLPKAANRPVYSYRLAIVHFWSLVFIYIWAGPHHLHYTALPAWASTLGMLFSLMLWMPSWGGMINGLLTLRGAWSKVAEDPILKFFVVGVTFYGMATFEGPMLSIKSVNALSHYTDWTIAHVHAGALGWVGFMTFGMIYWLLPRLFQTELWSKKLMGTHFWLGTIGILLYIIPIYAAGITQGLMWRAFTEDGNLAYQFIETVTRIMPFYWVRVFGGSLFLVGTIMLLVNLIMTWKARPKKYEVPVHQAPALSHDYVDAPIDGSRIKNVPPFAHTIDIFNQLQWHRRWERLWVKISVFTFLAIAIASLLEIVPTFIIKSNVATIETVTPYTPLELAGRDIYVSEGCYNCHSQMIRPIFAETEMYGEYSKGGEFVYDHPFQWGSRRIGPDLHRVGNTRTASWHFSHFVDPRILSPGSIMPSYVHFVEHDFDFDSIASKLVAMQRLGVPYSDNEVQGAAENARAQARAIMAKVIEEQGADAYPKVWETKDIIAITAYLLRLGTDIYKQPEVAIEAEATEAPLMLDETIMEEVEHVND